MIKFTDNEFDKPSGYHIINQKPQNYWDGTWVESIDETGNKVMVPAIGFESKKYLQLWKQDPNDLNHFTPIDNS